MRFAGASALLLLVGAGASGEDAVEGRVKWEQARLALKEENRDLALQRFEEALRGLPADPQLLYEAAECAFHAREYEKAEAWIEKAIRTDDAGFKREPDYQKAITLAARVRDVCDDIRRAAGQPLEVTYAKAFELLEASLTSARGDNGFLARCWRERKRDDDSVMYTPRDEWSHPRRWYADAFQSTESRGSTV
jgi:tetratricopeptide (TPR) repeat protein